MHIYIYIYIHIYAYIYNRHHGMRGGWLGKDLQRIPLIVIVVIFFVFH